jgi:ABC-type antimicrobial peptide transport system permease subunit
MAWLKIALRHHRAGRLYTLLNLSGLAIGITVALLIGCWVQDELSFNTVHPNYDRIARVMDNQPADGGINTSNRVPVPLAAELRDHYGSDFTHVALYYPNFRHILTVDEKASRKSVAAVGSWVQPELPVMLNLPMLSGNRQTLTHRQNTIISRSLAHALFGAADPMGRTIRVDNNIDVTVGGVFADIPVGSSFHEVNIFLPWDKAVDEMPWMKDYTNAWDAPGFNIYVQLGEHADINRINRNIKGLMAAHTSNKAETIFLQPMRQWHLYDEFSNGVATGGRIRIVRLFTGIGIFVLLLACINFMNLATARSEKRAKEVGIRKTLGTPKASLVTQFLGEALLMTLAATILALGIAWLTLPFFNRLSGKTLSIPWTNAGFSALVLVFILLTALLAGSYPAFYLSRFKPVRVLKGDLRSGPLAALPRKILVVLQFSVSISLIIGTILVGRQIAFAKDRPVGYTRAGLINIGKNTKDLYDANYQALRDDLLRTGMVDNMAEAAVALTEGPDATIGDLSWEGADPHAKPAFSYLGVTADYGRTIGWQLAAGRDFDPALKTDTSAVIINESAATLIGFPQPIGRQLRLWGQPHTIIGVVRNLVMNSPFQNVPPGCYFLSSDKQVNDILLRIRPERSMHTALAAIETVFRKYNPESPFDYRFVDTDYAQKFAEEERVAALARTFTLLAIFISCLGLFGLAAYSAEQRTKEIGVRKILGSSVFQIWRLLTADILRLVAISCGIAIPLAGMFMRKWLTGYTYRIPIGWDVFLLSGGMALIIAIATVSYHAVRAAYANPVRSLRNP